MKTTTKKTTLIVNTFCADIFVPRYDTNGHHVKNECVMTGAHAPTAEESQAVACLTAGQSYVRDMGYPYAIVNVVELCGACGGDGKIQKRRGKKVVPYAWTPCKACASWESSGQRPHGFGVIINRSEMV